MFGQPLTNADNTASKVASLSPLEEHNAQVAAATSAVQAAQTALDQAKAQLETDTATKAVADRAVVDGATVIATAQAAYDNSSVPVVSSTGSGIHVDIYNNTFRTMTPDPANLCRSDTFSQISANWGNGSVAGCSNDRVTIHYTGTITVPDTGNYSFRNIADDGWYMTINGQLVNNDWRDKGCGGSWSQDIQLTAGTAYALDAWYYENGGGACSTLYVTQPSGNWQVVPASWFGMSSVTTYVKDDSLLPAIAAAQKHETDLQAAAAQLANQITADQAAIDAAQSVLDSAKTALSSIPPYIPPINAPTNLVGQVETGTVTLSWTGPREGTLPERYAIMFSNGTSAGWGVATGNVGDANALNTTITLSQEVFAGSGGLDTTYTFSIRSDNDTLHMYSGYSNTVSLLVPNMARIAKEKAAAEAARQAEVDRLAAIARQEELDRQAALAAELKAAADKAAADALAAQKVAEAKAAADALAAKQAAEAKALADKKVAEEAAAAQALKDAQSAADAKAAADAAAAQALAATQAAAPSTSVAQPEPSAPAPAPAPIPDSQPLPTPIPEPITTPPTDPEPAPAEDPAPAPAPDPEPAPAAPEPQPEPPAVDPAPAPAPDPEPVPEPAPNPQPDPAPAPEPPADPQPVPVNPEPAPEPAPAPAPEPPVVIVVTKDTTAETWKPAVAPETYMKPADIQAFKEIGIVPNNAAQLPTDVPKPAPAEVLIPHVQVDVKGVENGGIQFFGTQTSPQVVLEDGTLTPPAPPPGSGLEIPPDAVTLSETFIGQPGGTTFNAPDVAVPVIETPVTGAIAAVPGVQALNHAFVAMSNIGNDMSPVTRKKAKKILVLTVAVGAIVRRRLGN